MGFGDFQTLCEQAAIPLCAVVGKITHISGSYGIEADCYARNIELANTIIFQGAASFMHIVALIMTVIMILHVTAQVSAMARLVAAPISDAPKRANSGTTPMRYPLGVFSGVTVIV